MQTDWLKLISTKCWKDPMEALGGIGFTHYTVLNHYFLGAVVQVGYVKNPVSLSKNIFFSIKLLHAYGKFFFSSNTLAVRTSKIILKLLLKTFSFSSNSDFFSCIRIFNTSNTKKCKKQCLNFTKPCQIFRCFVFPRRHEQREATLSSQCMVYC